MTLLPIVDRELRVAARRSATYWGRFSAALAALFMTGWALVTHSRMASPAQVGRDTFHTLSFVALITVITALVRLTAETISRERREGTLGFLFLTDLKSYDIILGKLAVAGLSGFYQFLAAVPALAVPMLMGGVTVTTFARMVLALINALFFSAALGMWASTVSRTEGQAASLATVSLLGIVGGLPLLGLVCRSVGGPPLLSEWLIVVSPGYPCVQAVALSGLRLATFWWSLAVTHAVGWLLLGLACWILPQVWKDRPASTRRLRWRERWQSWWQGDATQRKQFRTRLLDVNPIHWLTSRHAMGRWNPWFFILVMVALVVGTALKWDWPVLSCPAVLGVSWTVNAIFKTSFASVAARGFSTDRDQGALELLLGTPMTERELIRGQWLTLQRVFAGPVAALGAIEAAWMSVAAWMWEDASFPVWIWILMFAAVVVFLVTDLVAIGWVALWKSVTERNSSQAASSTQGRLLLLPWFALMSLLTPPAVLGLFSPGAGGVVVAWIVASATADFYFARRARRKLLTELRLAAALRFSGEPGRAGWWSWLGRTLGRWWRGTREPNMARRPAA